MNTQPGKQEAKYYTRTPNILFESYDLHPQEKWLYINLVYLCGKEGTRHLSLRYISDRTGISTGALGGMIHNLHEAGLIHAEIKRKAGRNGKQEGQKQYHISIVDIWQLNLEYFTEERSENEQSHDESVQNLNASVQNMNSNSQECSDSEQERSDFDTNIRLHTKTTVSNKTTKQEGVSSVDDTPAQTADNIIDFKEATDGRMKAIPKQETAKKPARKKTEKPKPTFELTAEQQAFWQLWRAVWFNVDIPPELTEVAYSHVQKLAPHITNEDRLNKLIDYTRKDLAESQGIKRKTVQLGNLVHSYSGWIQSLRKPQQGNGQTLGGYYYIGEAM